MPSVIASLWITFEMLGQWGLLILLATLGFVKSLPQANNPFLVNFLLTSFLATWPPCLLFFTAQQDGDPPRWLCFMQSVLMDGIAPMFETAMVVLVFHTWGVLKSKFSGETPIAMRHLWLKILLLLFPYVVLVAWCSASLAAGLRRPMHVKLGEYVYCANTSVLGKRVRQFAGFFMIFLGCLEFFFEFCIGRIFYLNRSHTQAMRDVSFESDCESYNIALRILIFCIWQLVTIALSVFDSLMKPNSLEVKQGTQVLESMNALGTFLVFGTQSDVLRVWKFWGEKPDAEDDGGNRWKRQRPILP